MNKQAMDEFIERMSAQETDMETMCEKEQEAFIRHQVEVLRSLETKMNTYFDYAVRRLLHEYVLSNDALACGDIIIDKVPDPTYPEDMYHLRFRLKDVEEFEIIKYHGKRDEPFEFYRTRNEDFWNFCKKEENILEGVDVFIKTVDDFKNYELFEAAIENGIEEMYDQLSCWKEKRDNERIDKLKKFSAQLSVETDCN